MRQRYHIIVFATSLCRATSAPALPLAPATGMRRVNTVPFEGSLLHT